jgi:signal transduction histidine kinase
MVGVFRVGPPDADSAQRPQPTLQDVAALVDASRKAGLDVRLHIKGQQHKLPDHIERTVYRVVQEALTNVHKHAGGSQAEVVLTHTPHHIQATISNTAPPAEFRRSLPSGGQGLIGLAERMELVGGTIDANPLPGGGFRVDVHVATKEGN